MPDPKPTSSTLDKLFGTGTGANPEASDREKYIKSLSPNQIQIQVGAGVLSAEEVTAAIGPGPAASALNGTLTASDQAAIDKMRANPPTNIPAAPVPEPSTAGELQLPSGTPSTIQGRMQQALATGSKPLVPEGAAPSTAAPISAKPTGGSTASAAGAATTSARSSSGSTAAGAPPTPAAPATPIPNSAKDLADRGAIGVGGVGILQGQQYRQSGATTVTDGKAWYIQGADGTVQPTPFPTQAAAKAAIPMVQSGPAMTSKFGNSPTAKAASQGGFANTIDPSKALFNTIGLDESIAAGATKGMQAGDILGTVNRKGYAPLDVTAGGISVGGGMTLATPGDYAMTQGGFTGQLPNNTSIGMSSINNAGQGIEALHMSTGIPVSQLASMNLSPQQIMQMDQAQATLRAQGLMPNLSSLYAMNEPSGYAGAAGGSDLKWGSANGGSSNTPYDQALQAFLGYADVKNNELQYLPQVDNGMGSTQVGNTVAGHQYDELLGYKNGGKFLLKEPSTLIGDITGNPYAKIAEAGKQEKVTIEPTGEDIRMGSEMRGGGFRPLRGGRPQPFAAGGTILGGMGKSSTVQYDDTSNDLGYKSQPYSQYGGVDFVPNPAGGMSGSNVAMPNTSASGQPVPASYEFMSPSQKAQFMENRFSNVSLNPIGTDPRTGLPIYQDQDPRFDYYRENGVNLNTVLKMSDNRGVPMLVQTYESADHPMDARVQKQNAINYLTTALTGGDAGLTANARSSYLNGLDSTNQQAMLAKLYDLDPKAAMLVASQMSQNNTTDGQGDYTKTDADIQRSAANERYYTNVDTPNRARAGMARATILDIPRQVWNGEGKPPWGNGPAPYQDYNGPVREGQVLPFDYNGPRGGGWGGGSTPVPDQAHSMPMPHTGLPMMDQQPWWMQRGGRWGRKTGAPLGGGLVGAAA